MAPCAVWHSVRRASLPLIVCCGSRRELRLRLTLSGNEQDFAGGLAGFEVAVGLGGFGEWVVVFEAELEGAVGDPAEDVAGALLEVGAGGDVVLQGGAGDEERAHGGELDEVEGRDGAAGSAVEGEQAAGAEAGEAAIEGGLADGVVDDRDALPPVSSRTLGRSLPGCRGWFRRRRRRGRARLSLRWRRW